MGLLRNFVRAGVILVALAGGVHRPAAGQAVVRTAGAAISVDVGKGVLITLPRPADTVFVADQTVADVQVKSPQLIYLFGKAPGNTSLYAVDADQGVLLNRPVAVRRDVADLQSALTRLHPDGAIRVSAIDKSVILSGKVGSPVDAEEIKQLADSYIGDDKNVVNRMTVDDPSQVNLRVRITEIDRTVVKELGINWEGLLHSGGMVFGLATGNPVVGLSGSSGTVGGSGSLVPVAPPLAAIPLTTGTGYFTRNPGVSGSTTDSIILGNNSAGASVNTVIDALEQNGLVNILAEPNLTALSGETASFLAGGEFPLVVPGGALGQTTIQFKQYGVSLAFTPVVLANGRISLRVRPEVSQLSAQGAVEITGISIPALTTRRAETTVELGSGQSFAIGGLLQNNVNDSINKLPGLGDLPILGALFRSSSFQRSETELVILVTPYLVRPATTQLATPTDGSAADPAQIPGAHGTGTAAEGLAGPAGFIVN